MSEVEISTTDRAVRRLRILADLYQQGQTSEVTERVLDKLIAYEVDASRSQLDQLEADLAQFEQQYDLSSADFYHRFQAGQTDDRMDYIEWASLVQMADNLRDRLELLAGETQQ